ncbi:tumor protein D54-like isoform X5 [Alosa alosa]|uniref:tpd52 like 2a isoform X2 n=1 Tax=Alosa sapidissima TaxID=34773 RepID=UPI001C09E0B0|nr:tpd52 like 2a isoform X2 [Alosa sapidissima]XP_048096280.1 tumor protein D54-like isoform X5 [Alosa alosa]
MDSVNNGFGSARMTGSMEGATGGTLPPGLTEEEAEELRVELTKVEDEIQTLRQVLAAKERHAGDIKRQLGISPLNEIKQNISKGWQDVQSSNAYLQTKEKLGQWNESITHSNAYLTASATLDDISQSDAYKKTQETLSQAGQVTSAALSSMGAAISERIGTMRALPFYNTPRLGYSVHHSLSMPSMRSSPSFRSFEDRK